MNLSVFAKVFNYFREIWFLWVLCLLVNIITFLTLYYKIHPSKSPLALHYNVLVGVESYGMGFNLYFIPAIGLAITAINFVLHRALRNNANFLSFLASFTSLLVQVILLFAVLRLITVN